MTLNTSINVLDFLVAKDARLDGIIKRYGEICITLEDDYFVSLASSIVGQQLSNKVADIIWTRLVKLLSNAQLETSYLKARSLHSDNDCGESGSITPQSVISTSEEDMRGAGLSRNKAQYIKALSSAVLDGSLPLGDIAQFSNDEVVKILTKVKGIGEWTAEMFLIFSLGRVDVFSLGDQGLLNALIRLHNSDKISKKEMSDYSKKFEPYRTFLALYLWKSLDGEVK